MAQRRNPSAVDEKDSNATFVNTNADDHRTTVAKAYHWLFVFTKQLAFLIIYIVLLTVS